jgi:DNA-binding transcriptional MerR regulator
MKPKELSEKTGLKERTIRFYEDQGLLSPQKTRQNGRSFRDYSQEDADRLTTIATLRRAGFTLEEIRTMLSQPEAVETIYPGYLQRVEQEAATAGRLLEVSRQVRPNGLDAYGLARQLERSAKYSDLPPADMEPHFGRLDPETPEEKARAIASYRSRKPGPKPQTVALTILGILCLCLLLTCAGMYRSYHPAAIQPEAAESTEGWLYYVTQENGSITTSESMTLPERTTSLYAHGSHLYYVVVGVEEPDCLWVYDAATGETGIIAELTEYTASLDVFFGENGMYVPNAVGESYIPY